MKDWFENLEARERLFVSIGAVIVIIAIFWSLVWQPLQGGHAEAKTSVANWELAVAELRPLIALKQSGVQPTRNQPVSNQSPVVVVAETSQRRGLDRALQRSQPTTSDGIRVEFENVAFDDLVLWLGDLSNQHALQVASGSVSDGSQTGPGRVNATLTLERAR